MVDFQYTNVPGKISKILGKIRSVGVPPKAHNPWLKSIGFTSSNDGTMLPVLKSIGFADGSGVPSQAWRDYRGKNHASVLAAGIRKGYADLFATYPEAWECSKEDLAHFFSTKSSAGEQVVDLTVRTFQNLCEKADFASDQGSGLDASIHDEQEETKQKTKGKGDRHQTPSLHIDIQIHISPEASTDQIEKIFKSMAQHLYRD